MTLSKRGSVFLITLTLLTVIFILGFSFTFFTGNEDYSAAMSYESEVAFNLAESAVEEFVARIKNALNDNSSNNQLYQVLRAHDIDLSKEIPLDANQIANLTAYTRSIALEYYGIQFDKGLVESNDFQISASLKLENINGVEATSGETVLYKIRQDNKEKQGELKVIAKVNYKGHEAKISLSFLIRCVKTFVPPFNYFTLFVRDSSVYGETDFNVFPSSIGSQQNYLRLDNGWNSIKERFDVKKDNKYWEEQLIKTGSAGPTPPGRVYLGQDASEFAQAGAVPTVIRPTNGAKLLPMNGDERDTNSHFDWQTNLMDGVFLKLDAPWTNMEEYCKKWVVYQGQAESAKDVKSSHSRLGSFVNKIDFLGLFGKYKGGEQMRIFNVGAGTELQSDTTWPPYENNLGSFFRYINNVANSDSQAGAVVAQFANPTLSGFHPFGISESLGAIDPQGTSTRTDYSKVSPTLIYGYAMNQYYRVTQVKTKAGVPVDLPYVDSSIFEMVKNEAKIQGEEKFNEKTDMSASQAEVLFTNAGVTGETFDNIIKNWNDLPVKNYDLYSKFMSASGEELYNRGLVHLLEKIRYDEIKDDVVGGMTSGLLDYCNGPLESAPYPYGSIPKDMDSIISNCLVREFYDEGPLLYAMPDAFNTYLYDFYFIPRSTEDFFRGRTTVAIGGVQYDRFEYKYINDVQKYRSGSKNEVLELNGILSLNDADPLGLSNLKFKGHGVIYSSPMMGGGKVVIGGDLISVETDINNLSAQIEENNMLTIIAPQIVINTDYSTNENGRCIVVANLMSVSEPLTIKGSKPITIKGSVVTTSLNLARDLEPAGDNVIIYNAMNGIWRNAPYERLMDNMYVAKIVTGGIGKFDWKYER